MRVKYKDIVTCEGIIFTSSVPFLEKLQKDILHQNERVNPEGGKLNPPKRETKEVPRMMVEGACVTTTQQACRARNPDSSDRWKLPERAFPKSTELLEMILLRTLHFWWSLERFCDRYSKNK